MTQSSDAPTWTRELPSVEGSWHIDEPTRESIGRDFGGIVQRKPGAVLRPTTPEDIVRAVRFARSRGIGVAARGRGHSTFGQSQVDAGIVVSMQSLGSVRGLGAGEVLVDGGTPWEAIVDQAVSHGMSPPALTDYLQLSVGGTLSFGGVGGMSFRHGVQTDTVLELEVVTGTGELVRCSADRDAALFDAVRAGLGQSGIIVGARIPLISVPECSRTYEIEYPDVASLVADHVVLAKEMRFDYLHGLNVAEDATRRRHLLTAVRHFDPGREPVDAAMLSGVRGSHLRSTDSSYLAFVKRVERYVARLQRLEVWNAPHPWLDVFIPEASVVQFVEIALRTITDVRDGEVLTLFIDRSRCRTPLLALPEGNVSFLVDVLRNAPESRGNRTQEFLRLNEALLAQAIEMGGTIYPIGAVRVPASDWPRVYPAAARLAESRSKFDPDGILAPGQRAYVI